MYIRNLIVSGAVCSLYSRQTKRLFTSLAGLETQVIKESANALSKRFSSTGKVDRMGLGFRVRK
jgi:hypothetical protein